ncbi:MAG: acetyl-CoA hydrolase [Rubrivivax sp.]|nr:acetyl-CoA hydrolase [Rubrivivax sp.]
MPQTLTRASFLQSLQPGTRVYWPGCAGHSPLFERWLQGQPRQAAGVSFCGVWIPGVNRFDPTALHPDARARVCFLPPALHAAQDRGAIDLMPLHYSDMQRWLGTPGRFDLLLLQVAPPDAQGRCSLSVAADFTPAVLAAAGPEARVLAHVNPQLPATRGPWVDVSRIHAWVQTSCEPLTVADEPPHAASAALAAQVLTLARDGDTVQLGLGRLQAAVLQALQVRRGLRLHSGMVSDGLLGLLQAGALAPRNAQEPPVCTGVALGSPRLYEALADPSLARFEPVSFTHAQATLAAVPQLLSVNAALQVDLFGNVNVEWLDGRRVSGIGGLLDFVRGARLSAGGRSVLALNATAAGGRVSRIVPQLAAGCTSVPRSDVDWVATEWGVVCLRERDAESRAQALIGLACPEHRSELQQAWHTLRRQG